MPDERLRAGSGEELSPAALVSALFADLGDLVQKEVALAKAEVQRNVMRKVEGAVWVAAAGVVFLVALLALVAGLVLLIASFGLAMHWSAFVVALGLAGLGLVVFMAGKSKLNAGMAPERSMRQMRRDVATIREQMQ
jgi:VIT1/CCC1 family predicted Fe2+/Mn2+ transporter